MSSDRSSGAFLVVADHDVALETSMFDEIGSASGLALNERGWLRSMMASSAVTVLVLLPSLRTRRSPPASAASVCRHSGPRPPR